MKRLLEDFEALFDLTYPVGDMMLGEVLERTLAELDTPTMTWGGEGRRGEVSAETGRFVSFYYRPHLFPGMDVKLRLAHELQYRLLPRELPRESPVSVAAVLESYCHLSGDMFGWELLRDGTLLIWIVDMAGHGVRSGLASAVLRLLIGTMSQRGRVGAFVSELNRMFHDCVREKDGGLYATLFVMAVGADGRTVYGSAAHPPALVRRRNGSIDRLDRLDLPVGLFADTSYRSRELRLDPGDRVLLYTDGLVEATGRDGEPFGQERLRRILGETSGGLEALTQRIYDAIASRQDIDELDDDLTFLAVEIPGPARSAEDGRAGGSRTGRR